MMDKSIAAVDLRLRAGDSHEWRYRIPFLRLLLPFALSLALIGCAQAPPAAGLPPTAVPFMPLGSTNAPARAPVGHIAFISSRDGPADIYVINADGSGLMRLTHDQGENSWPSFSPDGKQILYENTVGGSAQVLLMNSDGTQARNLTNSKSTEEFPSWSPDGMQILFTSDRDGHVGIYVMNRDGSNVRHIMEDQSNDWFPVWSPDGKSIAFISDRDGSSGNIFLMDPNGNHLKQVTSGSTLAAKPSWAPDSQRLAVFANGGFFATTRSGDESKSIVSDGEDPAWSPDGNWIAFASRRDAGRLQLYLTTTTGAAVQRITTSTAEDWAPSWGP